MRSSLDAFTIVMAGACGVVTVLAARGAFNSMFGFPLIFAAVCLVLGTLELWRKKPRQALVKRGAILLAAVAAVVGGWVYQRQAITESVERREQQVAAMLRGRLVPALEDVEPLNTDRATWAEASSFSSRATLITFWARWCSPCWKEMAELEDLYRRHTKAGLRVLALTRYDRPDDEGQRDSDLTKAQEFLRDREITYPSAITDDSSVYDSLEVRSPPGLVLVDERGEVVDFAIGLERSRSLMRQAVAMMELPPGNP